jgi:tRNA(Ile)-lysidine synthase
MLQQARKTISRFKMIEPEDRVLVAVSGGVDSMVLLDILLRAGGQWGIELFVAHLNHGLRGEEADGDAAFVKEAAEKLGLPFYLRKEDGDKLRSQKGLSLEEAARRARYRFLFEVKEITRASRIALGHHSDDNVETILMRLLRGCGPDGLAGIPPVGCGGVIRPMIDCSRAQIETYAGERDIKWRQDASNLQLDFTRNLIRHEILPYLMDRVNPRLPEAISRMGRLMRLNNDFVAQTVKERIGATPRRDDVGYSIAVDELLNLPEYLQYLTVRHMLLGVRGGASGYIHTQAVLLLAREKKGNARLNLPGGVTVFREYGRLTATSSEREPGEGFEAELSVPGALELKAGGRLVSSWEESLPQTEPLAGRGNCVFLEGSRIVLPLKVRYFRPADRFFPLGAPGGKKLKDFFIDQKVPPSRRRVTPLVISGEDIIWVAGIRPSDKYRVREGVKKILRLEWQKEPIG